MKRIKIKYGLLRFLGNFIGFGIICLLLSYLRDEVIVYMIIGCIVIILGVLIDYFNELVTRFKNYELDRFKDSMSKNSYHEKI